MTATLQRTGRLTTLLGGFDRGPQVIHAAEECELPASGTTIVLCAEMTTLCGRKGSDAAGQPLTAITCRHCRRTRRFRRAMSAPIVIMRATALEPLTLVAVGSQIYDGLWRTVTAIYPCETPWHVPMCREFKIAGHPRRAHLLLSDERWMRHPTWVPS